MNENELSHLIIGTAIGLHKKLRLLINFNTKYLKEGIHRITNNL